MLICVELTSKMSLLVKILIDDRNYNTWSFRNSLNISEIPTIPELLQIHPAKHRLFSGDVFVIPELMSDKSPTCEIVNSPVRSASLLAGVLQLSANKTYGRTANKKRLLYKCIPDDKRIPAFLVPYEPKVGFSKVQSNKYVVFRFDEWTDIHPHGKLVEVIGDVGSLDAFYEYQLYCKSLHISIAEITNEAKTALKRSPIQSYIEQIRQNPVYNVQERISNYHIFTIDPINSLDFDDGFSIRPHPTNPDYRIISVYIANVYVWLEAMGLWNSFSQRVATIYLPDHRRPMLPTILSDDLCSLQADQDRFAFTMDLTVVCETGEILFDEIRFSNTLIRVSKNYRYEDRALLYDPAYNELAKITAKMDKTVVNSHDVVSFWMIQMNTICAQYLAKKQVGIFRAVSFTGPTQNLDSVVENIEARRVINMWNNTSGQYLSYSPDAILDHELMDKKSYIHITSPIRRLVDLLNQMIFAQELMGVSFTVDASDFLTKWLGQLDYLNASMRSIRKIQTDCDLLYRCTTDPEIMSGQHKGIVFDKVCKNDGSGLRTYMVYLEKLKMLSRIIISTDLPNYQSANFKLFLFEDEDQCKRKIRLQIV